MENLIRNIQPSQYDHESTKELIINFITSYTNVRNLHYIKYLKQSNLELVNYICYKIPTNSIAESVYQWIHPHDTLCPECKTNNVKFINFSKGYHPFCSKKCGNDSNITRSKRIASIGARTIEDKSRSVERRKITSLKKYGVENYVQTDECKQKTKQTMQEKYGVDSAMQSPELSEKYKQSLFNNHGVYHPSQSKEIYQNRNSTMVERYGVAHAMQSPELTEKHRQTLQKNYGVDYPLQSEKIREKMKKTMVALYGKEYTAQVDYLYEKMLNTNMERYGVSNAFQSEDIREIQYGTMLGLYGVKYPLQSEICRENYRQTSLEKYGVEYPLQSEVLKKQKRKNMEERGRWISLDLLTNFERYYKQVIKFTNKQDIHLLDNYELRGLAGVDGAMHLDHKISIKYGFINSIPPYLIGNIHNLEMLPWYDNIYKRDNCSILLEQLCDMISEVRC